MTPAALLIGGTGFVGRHMQKILRPRYEVIATGRQADVRDSAQIDALVGATNPQVVVNFAALTTVRETFEDPLNTYRIGLLGTLNLLNALKKNGFTGTLLNISSSEVYGLPSSDNLPITEAAPLQPMSPYAVNKVATEALCYQWSQTEKFNIVTARPFTHIGPGQSDRFAISNFGKQIAEIAAGKKECVIRVGNLRATRDITDVRDVVSAYRLLLEVGESGQVYNICTGSEVGIESLLYALIKLSCKDIRIERDASLTRNSEQLRVRGCFEKLHQRTGWMPRIGLDQTLEDIFSYWQRKVRH
jgi:GDP-4-dehydro-6-deoxy-D-mannose reductase